MCDCNAFRYRRLQKRDVQRLFTCTLIFIGTVIFMIVFYTINAVVHFSFLDTAANAMGSQ